ncbi:hypothetical protein ACFY8P_35495 [Streptomyces sp. NPDC012693]
MRSHRSESGEITHVYAHAECAESRNVPALYSFIETPARVGERS